jgi:hypothetical protein
MEINLQKYKFAMFSALVLSLIVPFAGFNIAHASQTTDPYHIGKVADGTYNETAAVQRVSQIVMTFHNLRSQQIDLEKQLIQNVQTTSDIQTNKNIVANISAINGTLITLQNEYNQIQQENKKLYHIDPDTYQKYVSAENNFLNNIRQNYWQGKSFDEQKNAFPLVSAGINGKTKAIEIVLSKDVENSAIKDQYLGIISKLIPATVPWHVSYGNYPEPVSCTSRTGACTPIMGGISIGIKGKFACTMGFEATRSGVTGFVTAGHCAAGKSAGTSVYQPYATTNSTVGTLVTELYSGNNPVTCDCSFINTGSTSISDQIFYSSTYQPKLASTTAMSSQSGSIVQSGLTSGEVTGTVTSTNVSITESGGIQVTGLVKDSMSSDCGDSGSPVTNSLFSPSLYGIVVANGGTCGTPNSTTYHVPSDAISSILGASAVLN